MGRGGRGVSRSATFSTGASGKAQALGSTPLVKEIKMGPQKLAAERVQARKRYQEMVSGKAVLRYAYATR